MIESLRTRWIIIIAVIGLALFWVGPNFIDSWPMKNANKVNYGLDIQGGLHLVLGVDSNEVVIEKTARMIRGLSSEFKSDNIDFTDVKAQAGNREVVVVTSQTDKVKDFINRRYPATLQILSTSNGEVVARFADTEIQRYKEQIVEQSIEVIRNRIDEFGVSEPSITAQGDNRIVVQLPGIEDSARAKELINKTAKLNFRPVVQEFHPFAGQRSQELVGWITDAEKAGNYHLGLKATVANTESKGLQYSEYIKKLNADLASKLPRNTRVSFEKSQNAKTIEAGKTAYLLDVDNDLSGGALDDARVNYDEFRNPVVSFQFNLDGRRKFAEMTGGIAEKENGQGYMAIVLDEVVQSAPTVQNEINSDGAQITLGSKGPEAEEEAKLIATTLRAGALPAALTQLEERTVGPSLGADSIRKGKMAGLVGGILVLIFMLLYYKKLGVIANIALSLNILFILALLTSLGATLTLPGVAGIVLTIGMAVDANVIIFERIKEELRKGVGMKTAIKDGFDHAFSAIMDANITTVAVCIVLMYFGTGPIRGFAVTLICGVITSMFTSIFVSRAIIDLLIEKFGMKSIHTVKLASSARGN